MSRCLFGTCKYRSAGQDKLIRHLYKNCLLYRIKNSSKVFINANFVNNTVKSRIWLPMAVNFTVLGPSYWMLSRISEVGPNRKFVPKTATACRQNLLKVNSPSKHISFHSQIVPSQIVPINSQIVPQNGQFVPQKSQFVPHMKSQVNFSKFVEWTLLRRKTFRSYHKLIK